MVKETRQFTDLQDNLTFCNDTGSVHFMRGTRQELVITPGEDNDLLIRCYNTNTLSIRPRAGNAVAVKGEDR